MKWKSNVPIYEELILESIYDSINLRMHSLDSYLKYDFIIEPFADVNQILIDYKHISPFIRNGNLFNIGFNEIIEQKPIAFQIFNSDTTFIECKYLLKNNQLSFDFPNGYDTTNQLIIDPTIIASTLLSGSTGENWGHTATYDIES